MIESIDNTAYYLVSCVIYLFLALNMTIKCSKIGCELFEKAKQQVKGIIVSNPPIRAFFVQLNTFVFRPLTIAVKSLIVILQKIGTVFYSLDEFVLKHDKTLPGETINYSALLIRKLYNVNVQLMLSFAIIGIVVFYFILTVS